MPVYYCVVCMDDASVDVAKTSNMGEMGTEGAGSRELHNRVKSVYLAIEYVQRYLSFGESGELQPAPISDPEHASSQKSSVAAVDSTPCRRLLDRFRGLPGNH